MINCPNGSQSFQLHFKSVIRAASGILQKTTIHSWLQHEVNIVPHSLVPTILHEIHDSKGHQGTTHMFEAIRRSYW